MEAVTESTQPARALSNSAFLMELATALPEGCVTWITSFLGSPDVTDTLNWFGKPYNSQRMAAQVDRWTDRNAYFSVAALRPTADGEVRRRKANFARLLALVVDDVLLEDVQGQVSYVLQTSPGKTQVGIFLDGADDDCADIGLVDRLVTTMAEKGLLRADISGNNAVRYVRLPAGQNQKPRASGPFNHQLEQWNPRVRLSLADAAGAFGIDLEELRAAQRQQPAPTAGIGAQDERLRVLVANVMRGEGLHDGLNQIAASMVATGMPGGAVVNVLRAMMDASLAPKDDRWLSRYQDIPRSVTTAQEKFARVIAQPGGATAGEFKLRRSAVDFSVLRPVKWVLDGFLASAQVAVFAGQPGVGKSTVFSCMALLVAGYGERMGSDVVVSRPRNVVIVSEHAEQYERLFYGLAQHYRIELADLVKRIHLFDAARLAASEIPGEVMHLLEEAGGTEPPLITLDTASASFELKDENSNAEVGAMLAALKQPVTATGAPLWIVAHAAKALGREDPEITPRGASAYIGDVHATGSVFRDKNFPNSTFIKSLKNRNERDFSEIEVRTEVANFKSMPDEQGRAQHVGIRLGVPMQSGEITRRQAAQDAKESAEALVSGRHSKHFEVLMELLHTEPGMTHDLLRYRFYDRIDGKQDTKQKAFRRAWDGAVDAGQAHINEGKAILGKAVDNQQGAAQ